MIRERVDFRGRLRPMEPPSEIPALKLETSKLGLLKEAPAMRWKKGQDEWDRRYRQAAILAIKKRQKLKGKAEQLLRKAHDQGLLYPSGTTGPCDIQPGSTKLPAPKRKIVRQTSVGRIQKDRRWGPLDLDDETPPPSAIAKRRDTVSSHIHTLNLRTKLIFVMY